MFSVVAPIDASLAFLSKGVTGSGMALVFGMFPGEFVFHKSDGVKSASWVTSVSFWPDFDTTWSL